MIHSVLPARMTNNQLTIYPPRQLNDIQCRPALGPVPLSKSTSVSYLGPRHSCSAMLHNRWLWEKRVKKKRKCAIGRNQSLATERHVKWIEAKEKTQSARNRANPVNNGEKCRTAGTKQALLRGWVIIISTGIAEYTRYMANENSWTRQRDEILRNGESCLQI